MPLVADRSSIDEYPLYFSKVEPQYSRPCLHASEKDRAPGSKLAQERRATDSFMVRGVRQ